MLCVRFDVGGWGSIEYGNAEVAGQVEGGRWKPAHYWLKNYLFTDRIIACGQGQTATSQLCYVRNDIYAGVTGDILIFAIDLVSSVTVLHFAAQGVTLGSGPGAIHWFNISAVTNPNNTVLVASFIDSLTTSTLARNTILFTTPQHLTLLPVELTVRVSSSINDDATVDVYISKKANTPAAVWVTLATRAQGRFSDNAFVMAEERVLLQFIPFGALDAVLLNKTLRVETANDYVIARPTQSLMQRR
jgi:beta-mannosidase